MDCDYSIWLLKLNNMIMVTELSCLCIIKNEIIYLTFSRNAALQAKLAKCSVYEQFLMKVLDQLPEGTEDNIIVVVLVPLSVNV